MADTIERPVVQHIARSASLPWRPAEDHLTECGRSAADRPTITIDDYRRKLRIQGKERTAMTTCRTCAHTATRYKPWAEDPLEAIQREVYGMRGDSNQFRKELRALAALVANHPEEFRGYLDGLEQTADLAAHRAARLTRTTGRTTPW